MQEPPKYQTPKIAWSGGEFRTKCVVGLGRDGILNVERDPYCWKVEDFEPIPGSMDAMGALRRKGYKIVIITEQGGIERGLFTQAQAEEVNMYMLQLLGEANCHSLDGLYFSASGRKEDPFAKPNVGMFKKAEQEIKDIKFKEGYYVGNCIKDLKAAVNIGAKPVLVRTGKGAFTEQELNKFTYRDLKRRTIVFDDFAAFVESMP